MKKSVRIHYDTSNDSCYIWVAYIWSHRPELDVYAFPTLGHAMAFYNPQIEGQWVNNAGKWSAELKRDCAYKDALTVELVQLLFLEK